MTKKEVMSMTNEQLIKSIAVNNSKETKKAEKEMILCVEELAYRGVVNAETMKQELDL